jgi:hypothetical protein
LQGRGEEDEEISENEGKCGEGTGQVQMEHFVITAS